MTEINLKCMKCGSIIEPETRYCSCCGFSIVFQKQLSLKKIQISIRWVIFSVISIFIFEYIFATVAGQLFVILSGSSTIEFETSILVSSSGSLAGIFSGTLYSAYMSPGLSIKEPLIGAFIEILTSQLILLVLSGTFSYLFIIRIIIIMTVSFAGAKTGDKLQKRNYII